MRKFMIALFLILPIFFAAPSSTHASTFISLLDQAYPTEYYWGRLYPAVHGVLQLQFGRVHDERGEVGIFSVNFNQNRIYETNINLSYEWRIYVFWETESSQMFVALRSDRYVYIWGYHNTSGKFKRYLTIDDFHTGYRYPSPRLDGWRDGRPLRLHIDDGPEYHPGRRYHDYELNYDMQTDRIVYRYLGEFVTPTN